MTETPGTRARATALARNHRARTRRRVLAAFLGVVALLLVFFALQGPGSPASAARSRRLSTPLWSARRVPGAIVDDVGGQRLQASLDQSVAGLDACFVVSDATGEVAASAADAARIPASTQKLLTATAALDVLGPDFRYETKAVASAAPRNGSIPRLWLVGSGDPGVTTPEGAARLAAQPLTKGDQTTDLAVLADAVVKAGVRAIPGGVEGDDSHYDATRYLAVWPDRYRTEREIGPLGALTVNDGFQGPDGSGAPAPEPAVNAATQLARLLTARGVTVGPASRGVAPRDPATIASVKSPPLSDVLAGFLASSDNLTGELLVRELATASGKQGTTANGLAVIAAKLKALGLPTGHLVMVDGSGLSRDNRAPCSLLLATLELTRSPRFASVRNGLSVAGERGTLATRLRGTPLEGKLVAKTGSLSGVSGLAGFVDVKLPIEFSLLLNGGFSESTGVARREEMAQAIARYPDSPAPDALVPGPAAPAGS
ncbi:MAG: D-alanyl-D-alanine carboxypeptidase/D-alanyl-D-alanine endopeptidase [Acidimicrobiia bacterium]